MPILPHKFPASEKKDYGNTQWDTALCGDCRDRALKLPKRAVRDALQLRCNAASGNLVPAASQLVGEENPINGDREGFFRTCLNVDPDYLPALSSAFNKGALLGNRFVTIHVEIALFRGWIAVVAKHYL